MVSVTLVRRPARSSVGITVLPGLFVVVTLGTVSTAVVVALAGLAVIGASTALGSRRGVTLGGVGLFAATVLAGVAGASPGLVLLATAGTVVTWTTGQHVVGLGAQLGRDAPVSRSVVVHLAGTTVATLTAGGVGLVAFRVAEGSASPTALAFLLVGVAALVLALGS